MPAATADAAEIIALMTAGHPDLMGEILENMGIHTNPGIDRWEQATQAAASLASALNEHPAGRTSAAFARYLKFQGRREKYSKDSGRILLRLLFALGPETVAAAANGDQASSAKVLAAMAAQGVDPAFGDKVVAALPGFYREFSASEKSWEFSYLQIAPLDATMGNAAAACGGTRASGGEIDLVLADLPFSAFVGTTNEVDPVVLQVIKENANSLKNAKAVLFWVDWSIGNRLPSGLAGYRRFLSAALPGLEFRSLTIEGSKFGSSQGVNAFLAGATTWTGKFQAVESGLRDEEEKDVAAAVAESAIRGLLRAI